MAKLTSAPDLVRSIYLLWGHHPAPGRSGITVEKIVTAGVELADAQGLEATSMRRVAERLGASTMSLYNYVPSKEDLTALMVDKVFGELYQDVSAAAAAGDWQDGARYIAEANWQLYQRHPWMLDVRESRAHLGPHSVRKYEAELRPFEGIGLGEVEMDSSLHMLLDLVESTARAHRDARRIRGASGMSDGEWWTVVSPVLEHVMSGTSFPLADRVGTTVGTAFEAASNPEHTMRYGMETIIAGIDTRRDPAHGS